VTIAESKTLMRASIRAARVARAVDDRRTAADAIAAQATPLLPSLPGALSAYLSLPTEPGTDPIIAAAQVAGHGIRVPRIDGRDLRWVALQPDTVLATGPLGIREPVGTALDPEELAGIDLMLIPGLAVDHSGHRLGQGGGYYDRTLASVPSHADGGPFLAIVLFDEEVVDEVPHEAHDCRVDAALTPGGIIRFSL
jgi:5-formyltetrahydrofolate cyclo-ligase